MQYSAFPYDPTNVEVNNGRCFINIFAIKDSAKCVNFYCMEARIKLFHNRRQASGIKKISPSHWVKWLLRESETRWSELCWAPALYLFWLVADVSLKIQAVTKFLLKMLFVLVGCLLAWRFFFFFLGAVFFILDLHSITGDQDFLLLKHCGKTPFISLGSPRVVLENIYCLINSLCQVRNNPRYVFAVSFWSGLIFGAKYALQFWCYDAK